jgi:hypothetical protein
MYFRLQILFCISGTSLKFNNNIWDKKNPPKNGGLLKLL